jgi:hypothetical protein
MDAFLKGDAVIKKSFQVRRLGNSLGCMEVAVQPAKKAEPSLPTKTAEHRSFSTGAAS